ncbi:kinase [Thraustotheca clavata]|uniref:Kinase n=1 Tax=Thraustotheca clavata TaxID=74557 RepID=A0A1W0A148_9STRA|nr:kinase [Thraustotheca clavata]
MGASWRSLCVILFCMPCSVALTCDELGDLYSLAKANCSKIQVAQQVDYLNAEKWCAIPECFATVAAAAAWMKNNCPVPIDTYPGFYCSDNCRIAISRHSALTLQCGAARWSTGDSALKYCLGCQYLFGNLSQLHSDCDLPLASYNAISLQQNYLSSLSSCQITLNLAAVFPFNITTASTGNGAVPDSPTYLIPVLSICLGSVVLLGIVSCIFYRRRSRSKDRLSMPRMTTMRTSTLDMDLDQHPYVLRTQDRASMTSSAIPAICSTNDVRFDPRIIRLRIPQNEFTEKTLLMHGGQGHIYRAQWNRQIVIIKQIKNGKDYTAIQEFMQEIRISAALRHPHVVQFLGVSWSTLHDIAIVSDYMAGGDVLSILRDQRNRPIEEQWLQWIPPADAFTSKLRIAYEVSLALAYMHAMDLVHRDIKAKNVVLNSQYVAKLCDFGISRPLEATATMTVNKGTVMYMAPEVFTGERYSEKADIYSFGVLLAELDLMDTPYGGRDGQDAMLGDAQIAFQVVEGGLRPKFTERIPDDILVLADQCLSYVDRDRPSAQQLVQILKNLVAHSVLI